jgi:thymidine phosphorylase
MKKEDDAFRLARIMVGIGEGMGRKTVALITNMDQPLGNAIGNALEVKEAMDTLNGKGPADLRELCLELGKQMIMLGGKTADEAEAGRMLIHALDSGLAMAKFREFILAQGGNPMQLDNPELLAGARYETHFLSPQTGFVAGITADLAGIASMKLGAGRRQKGDTIDYGAGILLLRKPGDKVEKGELVATLYANDASTLPDALEILKEAYRFSNEKPGIRPLVLGKIP